MKPSEKSEFESAALALEALIANDAKNAFDRFVESLPVDLRTMARETSRLRYELQEHMVSSLNQTDMHVAMAHAQWVRDRIVEVVYRWCTLINGYRRWCETDASPIVVTMSRISP